MSLPTQVVSVHQSLISHLNQFDWSHLTPGKTRILNTFLRLAATDGYSAVTMRALGDALNLKAPSIYSHFPGGRDEIVSACLRWHYYNFGTEMLKAVEDVDAVEDFLDRLMRVHVRLQLEKPESDLWDILVASDRIGKFLEEEIRNEVNAWLNLCTHLYEVCAESIYKKDMARKARVVLYMLDTATYWGDWDGSIGDMERVCDQAVRFAKATFMA